MLTLEKKIGTPSWLELPGEEMTPEELKAIDIYANTRNASIFQVHRSKKEIYEMIECLARYGKKLYDMKCYRKSLDVYGRICAMAMASGELSNEFMSSLNSNVAACWLKLERPYECIEASREALKLNADNFMACSHLAHSFSMIYELQRAMEYTFLALSMRPECKKVTSLKEHIMANDIPQKFSTKVILERVERYQDDIVPPKTLVVNKVTALIEYDVNNLKDHFLIEAEVIIANKISIIGHFIKAKMFYAAYNELVNMHQIYHVRQHKYCMKTNEKMLHDMFHDKALCLYYMERYDEALSCCFYANEILKPTSVSHLIMEAKILYKLNRSSEAQEMIGSCHQLFHPTKVETLIMAEISILLNLQKSHFLNDTKNISIKANIAPTKGQDLQGSDTFQETQNKFKFQERNAIDKGSNSTEKIKSQIRTCDSCKVNVVNSTFSWNEHLKGRNHRKRISDLEQDEKVVKKSCLSESLRNLNEQALQSVAVTMGVEKLTASAGANKQDKGGQVAPPVTECSAYNVSVESTKKLRSNHANDKKALVKEENAAGRNIIHIEHPIQNPPELMKSENERFHRPDEVFSQSDFNSVRALKDCNGNDFKNLPEGDNGNLKDKSDMPNLTVNEKLKNVDNVQVLLGVKEMKTRQREKRKIKSTDGNLNGNGKTDKILFKLPHAIESSPKAESVLSCANDNSRHYLQDARKSGSHESNSKDAKQNVPACPAQGDSFPLSAIDYDIGIMCLLCLQKPGCCFNCPKNTLAVKYKNGVKWIAIRERPTKKDFLGQYRTCANKNRCLLGSNCMFAHSDEEAIIWNMEKMKRFSIASFIQNHRNESADEVVTIGSLCKAFPGALSFICGKCHSKERYFVGKSTDGPYCSNDTDKHCWNDSRIMIHSAGISLTLIYPCPENYESDICTAAAGVCSQKMRLCHKPHSLLERDVWNFLKKNNLSERDFLEKFKECMEEIRRMAPTSVAGDPPHAIKTICPSCWSRNVVSYLCIKTNRCTGTGDHPQTGDCLYYIPKARKLLKRLPLHTPLNYEYKICWKVQKNLSCQYVNCQFAHCREELETWKWMAKHKVRDPELVAKNCDLSLEAKMTRKIEIIPSQQSKTSNPSRPTWSPMFGLLKKDDYYCHLCDKLFTGVKDFEAHKKSKRHIEQVKSDSCFHWVYRSPPLDPNYELCRRHERGQCYYSKFPDEYNYCANAHSKEELNEWNERKRWKATNLEHSERDHLLSSVGKLLKRLGESEAKSDVIVERSEGTEIMADEGDFFRSTDKNCQHVWSFKINSDKPLIEVFLLDEHNRKNFSLMTDPSGKEKQYITGKRLAPQGGTTEYTIYVKFQSEMPGSFSQNLIFNFGTYPVIYRSLRCEIGPHIAFEKLNTIRLNTSLTRWTPENELIVHYPDPSDKETAKLLLKYPTKNIDEIMNEYPLLTPLWKNTYKRKMHGLLYLEELSRTRAISRYNLTTTVELTDTLERNSQTRLNQELHGMISLSNLVVEGSLVHKCVTKVMFKPLDRSTSSVYEALISRCEKNEIIGITGETITFVLSDRCRKELNLKAGDQMKAEVQLQLDRNVFCRMHYAIDSINNMEHLYPEIRNLESKLLKNDCSCPGLNARQSEIISYVFRQGNGYLPPLVVFGPFGTGKTETLAKASLLLAKEKKSYKILICAKSNVTADEYFKRYFCKISASEPKIIRIYSEDKRIDLVDREIQRYCLLNKVGRKFCLPSAKDILNSQIIVTTLETSFYLRCLDTELGISHIFIDEAGQDLECRTIIPFTLAEENTCIVVAGDHMQMGEEIHNQDAKEQNFEQSLMERLYNYYTKLKEFGKVPIIFLNENYRNHKSILSLNSQIYYGKEDAIIPKQAECQSNFKPLEFFAVFGNEVLNRESASIYNLAEVDEAVERVFYTYENWPEEWGRRDASQILVTSTYMDQIRYLRANLRKKSDGLAKVTVTRVHNVLGLEFRAVFITSVRTNAMSLSNQLECDSNNEDFLSQPKLLNSVFSRAKSYLAVVGDPVALCSIGKCSKIWVEFLKKCQDLKSKHFPEMTAELIKKACDTKPPVHGILQTNEKNYQKLEEIFQLRTNKIIDNFVNTKKEDYSLVPEVVKEEIRNESKPKAQECKATIRAPLPVDNLLNVLKRPGTYECQLRIDEENSIRAFSKEPLVREIIIRTRKLCKTALDRDEVIVRIKDGDFNDPCSIIYGEVLGILKRNKEIAYELFCCHVDEYNFDLMIPINNKIPKIKVLTQFAKNKDYRKKRHVCIYKYRDEGITFDRHETLRFSDFDSALFLVKVLKWDETYTCPLGVVIDRMKSSNNIDDAIKILDFEHGMPEQLEPNAFRKNEGLPKFVSREDHREMLVFTIDSKETTDIDDAIGFQIIDSTTILLSIHISDVSFHVDANSALDEEAKKRASSKYPPNRSPIHMFPIEYSTNICSLKEGFDREVLSIFMTLDTEGNRNDENIVIKRTLIRSKHRLTYDDVESVLMDGIQAGGRFPPELIVALNNIKKFTTKWKRERLGSDALEWKTDILSMDGPNSRALIEELMITANEIIAQFLLEKLPNCTPLRVQMPPNESELNVWRNEFTSIVSMTNGMRRYCKTFPEVCRCNGFCTCIAPSTQCYIAMLKDVWLEILNAVETHRTLSLQSLVHDLNKLPQKAVAYSFLRKLQEKAKYICSGEAQNCRKSHFSLNIQAYTHFTSPIRRYIDLVVHRLVINCIEHQPPVYSKDEIIEICQHCTSLFEVTKDYDKATYNALICSFLQARPLKIDATIIEIDENFEIELRLMKWHDIFGSHLVLKPTHLCLEKQPETEGDLTCYSWCLRICWKSIVDSLDLCSELEVNPMMINLTPLKWQRIVCRANDLVDVNEENFQREFDESKPKELVSECNGALGQYCRCLLKLKSADMITIQISSKLHKGLLTPFVQMLFLTNQTTICVEHNEDPVRCFSELPRMQASKSHYGSLKEYKDLWSTVLSVESSASAITNVVPMTIHNVLIQWELNDREERIVGRFKLETYFCSERGLKVETIPTHEECCSYLCVRYHDVVLDRSTNNVDNKIERALAESYPVSLIFHCLVKDVRWIKNKEWMEFTCIVNQSLEASFEKLLSISSDKKPATIEWIEQPLPIKRMLNSLELLSRHDINGKGVQGGKDCKNLELAEKIALTKKIRKRDTMFNITWPGDLLRPNPTQERAIRVAMRSPFSLIQGPPGTGKTYVMAHLVNQFHIENENTEYKVMCCGPSNKSADVVATSILRINDKIEVLRVYGESVESKHYNLPYPISFIKEKIALSDEKTDDTLHDYTLHHLIRNEAKCEHAKEMLELENYIRKAYLETDIKMTDAKLETYKKLKAKSEQHFVSKAGVIITTCIGCGAPKFKSCSFRQLLIDESGMCKEPESMTAIVETGAQRIVLIGDHKQLRPIVVSKHAAVYGLETSLFQRYKENAIMLTSQYRMHDAIVEFPSKQFYNGKLKSIKDSQKRPSKFDFWPGGRHVPIAFVNVEGSEESLTTSTKEGGFRSKKNVVQAKLAADIASRLVRRYGVNQKEIIILSQYRSQCTEITNLLKQADLSSVSVSTVVSAQGSERKYVILSTVRSLPKEEIERYPDATWTSKHLGFTSDQHQINVALTRAEEGLIILGNQELLGVNRMWKDLLSHYREKKALVEIENFKLISN